MNSTILAVRVSSKGERGGEASPPNTTASPPLPPKKKEGERGGEREREVGGEGGRGGREKHVCSLREAILFVGGVRERERRKRYAARVGAMPTFHP